MDFLEFLRCSPSPPSPGSLSRTTTSTTHDYPPSKKQRLDSETISSESSLNFPQDTFPCLDEIETLISKNEEPTFTQICDNSTFMRHIDEDIKKSNQKAEVCSKIAPDYSAKKCLDFETSTRISPALTRSELPKDEVSDFFTSSNYRREIESLFDKVEQTICEPGPNQDSTNAREKASNILKIDDVINWEDDSLLTKAVLSPEHGEVFGNTIKELLLRNAGKAVSPTKLANQTILPTQYAYKEQGDFYGLPSKVKDLIRSYRGIDQLYDWQRECLSLPGVKEKKNLVYALPTSGGKTLVAEILMLREILCWKRNALFVLPYVAIVQEKVWGLSPFAVALDFLVEEYAAGKGNYPPRKRRRKNSAYVATIEKALGIVNSLIETGRIDEIGLIIIDELHLLGDQSRGAILEELLSKILCLEDSAIQIIGMSATIGNLPEICQFLNAEVYTQNFRPVELVEYVKCADELAKINWQAKTEEDLLVSVKKYNFHYSEKFNRIDPDHLGGLIMEVVPKESCLVFCSSKKSCENVVSLLCRVISISLKSIKAKQKEDLKRTLAEESGNLCPILKISIPFGIAYHHSGLTSDERRLIEEGFRASILSVICCTSTLAAGVNLPAKRVILRQPYIGKDFINLSRYKQMVGRAGRAGLGSVGESIVICAPHDLPKVKRLLKSPMDEARSSLHQNEAIGLRQFLLSCVSLNIAINRVDLHKMARRTLCAVQESRLEISLRKLTDKAIVDLFKLGALRTETQDDPSGNSPDLTVQIDCSNSTILTQQSTEEEASRPKVRLALNNQSKLVISKLGSAAIKGGLELKRAHLLYNDLLQAQSSLVLLDCLHLLFLVTPYDFLEQIKPSKPRYYRIFTQLGKNEMQTAKILGLTESCAIRLLNNQPIKSVPERVLNRFYITLMLYDLWKGATVFQVADKFDLPRGFVQNLMTSSAAFASNVVNFCSELEEFWCFAYLLRGMTERLQHCCVRELLPLMELPSVKQSRARQLYNAGYKNLASIAKADPNDLTNNIEYMSRKVANQLIATAKLLLLERVENLREEAEDVMDGVEPNVLNQTMSMK